LLDLVKASNLPDEFKSSFVQNFRYIKYEEAGKLQNGLRGIDKDLGTTFAYLLRSDLVERASTDADQRTAAADAATKSQKETAERLKLTARITLSISALAVLALIGWILIRREIIE